MPGPDLCGNVTGRQESGNSTLREGRPIFAAAGDLVNLQLAFGETCHKIDVRRRSVAYTLPKFRLTTAATNWRAVTCGPVNGSIFPENQQIDPEGGL